MPMTVSRLLGSPYTRSATAPRTARGSSTTQPARPLARAASRPVGSVRTATAPRDTASATYWMPCVRAPGSAAYRSPGPTSAEASVTPRTCTSPAGPSTGSPTRSASSASSRGRSPGSRGTDPASVGVTGLQSTGGGGRGRAPRGARDAAAGPRGRQTPPGRGSGGLEDEVRTGGAGGDDAPRGQRVPHDVGEHGCCDLPSLGVAARALQVDGDDVLGVVGRREPDERGDVPSAV